MTQGYSDWQLVQSGMSFNCRS